MLTRWAAALVLLRLAAIPCFAEKIDYDASGNLVAVQNSMGGSPEILRHPQSRVLGTNQSVSFSVVAGGLRPLAFQWQFNGTNILDATNDSLLLLNLSSNNFGAYRVIVSNSQGSVTSSNATLELDHDRDGLPDAWEIANFGSLTNQLAWSDRDNDGVRNLDEFYEGTSPTNRNAYNRRLSIRAGNGQVIVDPLLPYYTNGQRVNIEAVPDPGQSHIAFVSQTFDDPFYSLTNPAVINMTSSFTNSALMGVPISAALDTSMPWTLREASFRAGNDGWFGQTNVTHDGVDALQSFRRLVGSYLVITNVMPRDGTVAFWWRVNTLRQNLFKFSVNGTFRPDSISGDSNWVQKVAFVPRGTNILRWVFTDLRNLFDGSAEESPEDIAWIDELVVEPYDDPLTDRDGDAMPDLFEFRYFDNLARTAQGDADNDGVSNLDEYLENTDPTSNISLLPRLFLETQFGSVIRNPDKAKYNYGETVALEAVPDPGNHFVKWQRDATAITNLTNSIRLNGSKTVGALFGLPLPEVLDAPALSFTRGGHAGFYGQTLVNRDGIDAAASAPLAAREESWMETTLSGPGSLTFWWKISAGSGSRATFTINGLNSAQITGETNWRVESFDFSAGTAALRWMYTNNFNSGSLSNASWVDQVTWIAGESAPRILEAPTNTSVFTGTHVAFSVRAAGTPPLSYEWFQNGVSLGPPTPSPTFTLGPAQNAWHGRTYTVRVSNSLGATSSPPALLEVFAVPPANDNFAQRALLTGSTAARGHNVGATTEPNEPGFGSATVWWRWTAPASGRYRAIASAARNESASLTIGVYQGSSLSSLQPRGFGSAFGTFTNGHYEISAGAVFNATAGAVYAISVDGDPQGFFDAVVLPVVGPANDHFANRTPLTGSNVQIAGTTLDASPEPNEPPQGFQVPIASVWYTWTAPSAGSVVLQAEATDTFPYVSVYTGATLVSLTRIVDGSPEFGGANVTTTVEFDAAAGVAYQIQIGEHFTDGGPFNLSLEMSTAPPARILSAYIENGAIHFVIAAPPGATVIVGASSNLNGWAPIRTLTVSPGGTVLFSEALNPAATARLYRFHVQP